MIVDGDAVNSCLYLATEIEGRDLLTIEGLALFFDGQQDEATKNLEALVTEPSDVIPKIALSWVYAHQGKHGQHEILQRETREYLAENPIIEPDPQELFFQVLPIL